MTAVTYKGGAPALADVIAGHVPVYFRICRKRCPCHQRLLRCWRCRARRACRSFPDLRPSASRLAEIQVIDWNGLLAPAGTPKDIVERIAKEVARAVAEPALAERIAGFGVKPLGNSPEQFAAMITADTAFWAEAVRSRAWRRSEGGTARRPVRGADARQALSRSSTTHACAPDDDPLPPRKPGR